MKKRIEELIKKGVQINSPESIEIGEEVDLSRISKYGVKIYAGSKIYGNKTLISKNVEIGFESPQTIVNCQIDENVKLNGGFCIESVFLKDVKIASCSHIRKACILEEKVKLAHSVGLKQTILFPFVTLGSLINFCDCFMAGGTSIKNHSEIGSSYIHFNYTPNQDKATPSLLGNVYDGVMLDKKPIFLGGQGGLVGPAQVNFGTVIAAGTIHRKDELEENMLIYGATLKAHKKTYIPAYVNIKRIVNNNLTYINNLIALKNWYFFVRKDFFSSNFEKKVFEDGLLSKIEICIAERIKQFKKFYDKLEENNTDLKDFPKWIQIEEKTKNFQGDIKLRDAFLKSIQQYSKKDYLAFIQNLENKKKEMGRAWLKSFL